MQADTGPEYLFQPDGDTIGKPQGPIKAQKPEYDTPACFQNPDIIGNGKGYQIEPLSQEPDPGRSKKAGCPDQHIQEKPALNNAAGQSRDMP